MEKNFALRAKSKINSNSCVVRIFFSEQNKKTITPPPFKLNGRSLTVRENVREAIQNGQYRDTNT